MVNGVPLLYCQTPLRFRPLGVRHFDGAAERQDMGTILITQCVEIVQMLVAHLRGRISRVGRNRIGGARRPRGATAARIGVRHTDLVVVAVALLDAGLQRVVLECARVDELEHPSGVPRGREYPRDRGRPGGRGTDSRIQLLQHVEIAMAGMDVVGADRDAPRQLLLDPDARLMRERQCRSGLSKRTVPVFFVVVPAGTGIQQGAIDDRAVAQERIGGERPVDGPGSMLLAGNDTVNELDVTPDEAIGVKFEYDVFWK